MIDDLPACACSGGAPPADRETCNGIDDDCDGAIDEDDGQGGGCDGLGEACDSYLECAERICVGDIFFHYCSLECDPAAADPCPDGYVCQVGSNLDYCRKLWPACDAEADCAPDRVCTVQTAPDGLGVVTECRPPLEPGGAPGADCDPEMCANDICSWAGLCSEVCAVAAPCPADYLGRPTACVQTGYNVLPGRCSRDAQCPQGYTCSDNRCSGPACVDDAECEPGYGCVDAVCTPVWQVDRIGSCQIACQADGDCPDGLACQLGIRIDGSAIQGKCAPLMNGNPTGASCAPDGCDHGLCITGDDYCTQLCAEAADCPPAWSCIELSWTVGDLGTFPAAACVQ